MEYVVFQLSHRWHSAFVHEEWHIYFYYFWRCWFKSFYFELLRRCSSDMIWWGLGGSLALRFLEAAWISSKSRTRVAMAPSSFRLRRPHLRLIALNSTHLWVAAHHPPCKARDLLHRCQICFESFNELQTLFPDRIISDLVLTISNLVKPYRIIMNLLELCNLSKQWDFLLSDLESTDELFLFLLELFLLFINNAETFLQFFDITKMVHHPQQHQFIFFFLFLKQNVFFFVNLFHCHLVFLNYLFIVIRKTINLILSVCLLNINLTQVCYHLLQVVHLLLNQLVLLQFIQVSIIKLVDHLQVSLMQIVFLGLLVAYSLQFDQQRIFSLKHTHHIWVVKLLFTRIHIHQSFMCPVLKVFVWIMPTDLLLLELSSLDLWNILGQVQMGQIV